MTTSTLASPADPSWCTSGHTHGSDYHRGVLATIGVTCQNNNPTDVRLSIERHDNPQDAFGEPVAVTLEVVRRGAPDLLDVDVAALTGAYSDRQCRVLLAQYFAGCEDQVLVDLTVGDLLALSAAAARAATLLTAETRTAVAA